MCFVGQKNNMQLFAVASSRQVCGVCHEFLLRNAPTTQVVDVWKKATGRLTQEQRKDVNLGPDWATKMRERNIKAEYSHTINS